MPVAGYNGPMASIAQEVLDELFTAVTVNKPMNSLHEAHSVIEEEFDEFWEEVKKNPRKHPERTALARKELIQLAAMAIRAIHDVCDR